MTQPINFKHLVAVKQRGVVLFLALIALVALSLAAVALIRSVDTSTLIAGNIAFKQSATTSADAGVESAIASLAGVQSANSSINVLTNAAHPFNITNAANGYYSNANSIDLFTDDPWDVITIPAVTDSSGNTIRYIIERMCRTADVAIQNADCLFSDAVEDSNGQQIALPQDVCDGDGCPVAGQTPQIRITARATGPKNSVSYVQAFVYQETIMKEYLKHIARVVGFCLPVALGVTLLAPPLVLAASVALATSPLATSTTTAVKPNLLFVLDDSGSMSWTYMPDTADDFRGMTGYHSSQCNGVYYNPNITYKPPLTSAGIAYSDASFTAAKDNGFDASSTARDLNSQFIANRFSPEAANSNYQSNGSYILQSLGPYAGHYYNYTGVQTTKKYSDTSSTFYTECNTGIGVIANSSGSSNVFTKVSLSSSASATTATIVVGGSSLTSTSISSIKVNGTQEILAATSTADASTSNVAENIKVQINACTSTSVGNCTAHGYTATRSNSTVTITGLAETTTSLKITKGNSGSMTLLPTIFPIANTTKLTNFANWYSFYRTRMQMMKTASGRAFSSLNNSYRVGLTRINSSATPSTSMGIFESTHRGNWYTSLYDSTPNSGTPLREALSNAGRYYAGLLADDPMEYSCQQNFTILSTDGYWNGNDGFKLNGSTAVGNQDGLAGRPMYDGAQASTTTTTTYTSNDYRKSSNGLNGDARCPSVSGTRGNRLISQPQIQTCSVPGTCTAWSDNGPEVYVSGYSTCQPPRDIPMPNPNPSTRVVSGTPVTSPGSTGGTSDMLADVAMYYYQTDLRPGTCTLCTDNVFISSTDNNLQQHMTTFTLGLGASGNMLYSSSYLNDTSGDYFDVKLGSTATSTVCTWQAAGTTCNWPTPSSNSVRNIDDLWHAAVNGRGVYFSATDPSSLATGLSNALAGINARKGSAAAAATSTLNPVESNNSAYVASYTTVAWKGNLEARGINTDTGAVNESATWCVENVSAGTCALPSTVVADTSGDTTSYSCVTPNSVICSGGVMDGTDCKVPVAVSCTGTMNAKVSATTDTRTIKTANSTGTALIDFDATYASANSSYFNAARIGTLSQWTSLGAQQSLAEGANLVNYLRGQTGYEDRTANAATNRLYRSREAVLGDALESQPAFISKPVFRYPYPGYSAYATAQAGRAGTVYMGANDGMMHAFAADTGIERWAYVPSMVIPNMWKLADSKYVHINLVNGSPITSDVCVSSCSDAATAVWKTILVAGLNGGGRGYYALDITTPATPVLLWEFTPTTGIGKIQDDDVGYSFGQPIITRKTDGTWVVLVTSGYNNTSPGDGKGYLYVLNANTGAIISKIAAAAGGVVGDGLAKIAGRNNEPAGNAVGSIYGGDLAGNVWRFNINGTTTATIGTGDVMNFAILKDSTGATQPITTAPVLGKISGQNIVFVGTGKYLGTDDLSTTTPRQSQYAIKDDNAVTTFVNPRATLVRQTLSNNADGTATRTGSNNVVNFYTGRGWYFDFPDTGERVNIDSKLVQGTLLIPSLVPSSTECSPGGYGWLNFVDYKTGGAIETLVSQKYDATIVGVNVIYVQGQPKVGVVTSSNPTPVLDENVSFPASAAGFTGKRSLWRELTQQGIKKERPCRSFFILSRFMFK